ncbi:SMI1/KNR4 family protein [Acidovorax sp. NCPPB 3859]|nr:MULTISPECIES: SMI1/KNR4 family protein [unclassified Acidovorax]MDA8451539.1 SMI1/KNR4 family protein [Acidovorax sp. GBBC 3297]MDA8461064.1 SMI1/KNR4 family protein [Acidovorax sp. GBBC 3333]MDA8466098.1 SMI1/KNR4 family protein [Acidovorax sp. GBBC 3332]MDA8471134.1 SMI1/KNR4 family protein [Acidovorax sp. GBBC 3299]WCM77347.1 SMI1/KNR4 family protein [Acidovorax sp. GBBC 712]
MHESAIAVLEGFLGLKIPGAYRIFLLNGNGAWSGGKDFDIPEQGATSLKYFFPLVSENVVESLPYKIKLYKGRIPEEMLPIGSDDGGNLLLISLKGKDRGAVFFWDHEMEAEDESEQPYYDNIKILSKNFDGFLKFLKD